MSLTERGCRIKQGDGKTRFRLLVEYYGHPQGIKSQQALKECIERKGLFVSLSTINKYLRAEREATDEFIYHAALCLGLNDAQVDALIEAAAYDWYVMRMHRYRDIVRRRSVD